MTSKCPAPHVLFRKIKPLRGEPGSEIRRILAKQRPQSLQDRAIPSRLGHNKIVFLGLKRNETKARIPGNGLNRHAPIRPTLINCGGDGVVELHLA